MHLCMCICRSQMLMSSVFPSHSPPSFLRQSLSLHQELMNVARPTTGNQTPGPPSLCLPRAGIIGHTSLGLFCGSWHSKSFSCFMENTLVSQLPSQLRFFLRGPRLSSGSTGSNISSTSKPNLSFLKNLLLVSFHVVILIFENEQRLLHDLGPTS